ncbi:MAG: sensor domain-containing protein, partial [Mycobacterium sp.]
AGFNSPNSKVMFVEEAVVALPSTADARALFAKFSEQWRRCDRQAVNQEPGTPDADNPPPIPGTEMHITDVRVTDTVLAASIVLNKNPKAPDTRAVGVQGNCLVEVLIAYTGAENGTGSADPKTSSIDAVRAMMDKVSKLS